MESFLTTISRIIREKKLSALLIGGHAVTALGHPRATFDLDLLIPRSAADAWRNELELLKYKSFAETPNFLQFESDPNFPLPPIDLMIVTEDVFDKLFETRVDSTPIATPGVTSMIALKLHAINQPSRTNVAQDWADIFSLIRVNKLSLDDPDFFSIISKYGGEDAIGKIKAAIASGS